MKPDHKCVFYFDMFFTDRSLVQYWDHFGEIEGIPKVNFNRQSIGNLA